MVYNSRRKLSCEKSEYAKHKSNNGFKGGKMKIKVMSFNLRVHTDYDGKNRFFNRTDRVLEVIDRESPDVIGFQEVTDSMRVWLRENLKGYTVQGCGREPDCRGEAMAIAYKSEDVELMSLDNFWLSLTPRVPGSSFGGDQSPCPRMATTLLLKHKDSSEPFRFINTHLDHVGKNARYLGAVLLVQTISAYREKFVLTGDFNALPDSPEIGLITDALGYRGAIDCTAGLGGTYHGYGALDSANAQKIDYIFTDGKCKEAYAIEDIPVDGMYYSDHNAVCAVIELP